MSERWEGICEHMKALYNLYTEQVGYNSTL